MTVILSAIGPYYEDVLTIAQEGLAEMGLTDPFVSLLDSTSDGLAKQCKNLMQATGKDLVFWPGIYFRDLIKEWSFVTDGTSSYMLPSDFARYISNTAFQGNQRWGLRGPLSSSEWQILTKSIVYSGPQLKFRIWQNKLELFPVPAAGITITCEYVRNTWLLSDGVPSSNVLKDADTPVLPPILIKKFFKVKFKDAKGLDSDRENLEFKNMLDSMLSAETGAMTVSMDEDSEADYPLGGIYNLPDGNYGL
jgi:hypothetical protein